MNQIPPTQIETLKYWKVRTPNWIEMQNTEKPKTPVPQNKCKH